MKPRTELISLSLGYTILNIVIEKMTKIIYALTMSELVLIIGQFYIYATLAMAIICALGTNQVLREDRAKDLCRKIHLTIFTFK